MADEGVVTKPHADGMYELIFLAEPPAGPAKEVVDPVLVRNFRQLFQKELERWQVICWTPERTRLFKVPVR